MGLLDFLRRKQHSESNTLKNSSTDSQTNLLTVKVIGTNYRDQKELLSLGKINADYSLDKKALLKNIPKV